MAPVSPARSLALQEGSPTAPIWDRGAEGSAYIHWWDQVERWAAEQDGGLAQMQPPGAAPFQWLTFLRTDPSGLAQLASPDLPTVAPRRVPMWPVAISPGIAAAGPAFGDPPAQVASPPPAVLVVIDTAINPVHARFRGNDGAPRILAHWQMEAPFKPGETRVRYGRELRQADLVAALALGTEDEALTALGAQCLTHAFAPRGTAEMAVHGTHVLDLAGGTDPQDPAAAALRNVPVLAVSLPSNRVLSTSGAFLEVFVDQALAWVEQRLTDLFGVTPPPVVVNLSYGLAAGPKEGGSPMARRLAAFLARNPQARLCMPAGNDGAAQGHAVLTPGGKVQLVVLPGDNYSVFLEIWLPDANLGAGRLRITAPCGAAVEPGLGWAAPGAVDITQGGRRVARLYRLDPAETPGQRGCLLCIAPTDAAPASPAEAPGGLWSLELTGSLPDGVAAQLHLQSERPLMPNSRNSHPARLWPAEPEGTLSDPAVGSGAVIVAGYRLSDDSALEWSSRGWTPDAARGPHVSAPAERSAARRDVIAAGYRSGTVAQVAGTSFASALAARDLLDHLLAGGMLAAWPAGPPDVPPALQARLGRHRLRPAVRG